MESFDILSRPGAFTVFFGIIAFILLLWYSYKQQSYWKNIGVPCVEYVPIIQPLLELFFPLTGHEAMKRYFKFGPIYGYYRGNTPAILVSDANLFRQLFVKDFKLLPNREGNKVVIQRDLLQLEGEDWKRVRSILAPLFSTGKLKSTIGILEDCSRSFIQNLKIAPKGQPIDVKRWHGDLVIQIIASLFFSIKMDPFKEPKHKFLQAANREIKIFAILQILLSMFPFMSFILYKVQHILSLKSFREIFISIFEERKKTGQAGNDYLQSMIERTQEVVQGDERKNITEENERGKSSNLETVGQNCFPTSSKKYLSIDELIDHCRLFLLAGLHTSSSTLSFAFYVLAVNENIQEKARKEIFECLKKTKNELTYEALQEMKYLENVILETLRLYPPVTSTSRVSKYPYKLGNTGITVPKNMSIIIPIYEIHRDPKYYPEPEKFDPNRFTEEEKAKRNPYVYLPFGAGPRNCIGLRLGLLQIKVSLVYCLSFFNIKTCSQTQIPLELYNTSFLLGTNDIVLKVEPRNDSPLVVSKPD